MKRRPVIQAHILDPGPLSDDEIAQIFELHARLLVGVLQDSGATLATPAATLDGLPYEVLRRVLGVSEAK